MTNPDSTECHGEASTDALHYVMLFHIDDCMYVAAMSEADAVAYVRADCGEDCADSVEPASLDMKVETADVDDGEKPTKDSKTTARKLVEEHLHFGGTLPYTVCFDAGM